MCVTIVVKAFDTFGRVLSVVLLKGGMLLFLGSRASSFGAASARNGGISSGVPRFSSTLLCLYVQYVHS